MGAGALVVEERQIEGCGCEGEAGEEVGGETHPVDGQCRLEWGFGSLRAWPWRLGFVCGFGETSTRTVKSFSKFNILLHQSKTKSAHPFRPRDHGLSRIPRCSSHRAQSAPREAQIPKAQTTLHRHRRPRYIRARPLQSIPNDHSRSHDPVPFRPQLRSRNPGSKVGLRICTQRRARDVGRSCGGDSAGDE